MQCKAQGGQIKNMTTTDLVQKINSQYQMPLETLAWIESWINHMLFEERQKTVIECKEQLLKQLFNMRHTNGYPSDAVPKATILSLPELMKVR